MPSAHIICAKDCAIVESCISQITCEGCEFIFWVFILCKSPTLFQWALLPFFPKLYCQRPRISQSRVHSWSFVRRYVSDLPQICELCLVCLAPAYLVCTWTSIKFVLPLWSNGLLLLVIFKLYIIVHHNLLIRIKSNWFCTFQTLAKTTGNNSTYTTYLVERKNEKYFRGMWAIL